MGSFATQALGGPRNDRMLAIPLTVPGLDVSGLVARAQIRMSPDNPVLLLDVEPTDSAAATGIRTLPTTTDANGVKTSHLVFQVAKADMQALPFAGEAGDPWIGSYAFQIDGITRLQGPFVALASAIDSNGAPENRAAGSSGSYAGSAASSVTLSIGDGGVTVSISGADLIASIAAAAAAERVAAEAAARDAQTSAQQLGAFGVGNPSVETMIPIVAVGSDVVVWLDAGMLAAAGVAPTLLAKIIAGLPIGSSADLVDGSLIPIAVAGADVAVWLDGGKLSAAGVSDALVAQIVGQLTDLAKVDAVASRGQMVIRTDGRSLKAYSRKKNAFARGAATILTVAQLGDSWTGFSAIPQEMANLHYADMAMSAPGWLTIGTTPSTGGGALINGVVFTISNGWTLFDGAPGDFSMAVPPRACGPDIYAIHTTSSTDGFSFAGWQATQITGYYWDGSGTFRYRIDGGSWTVVACKSTNAKAKFTVAGLADALHTIEVDTTGNTGLVEFYGFNALSPAKPGVVFHQIGNGSARGLNYTACRTHLAYYAADLAIDLAYVLLGTNDYVAQAGYGTYAAGVVDIVQGLCPSAGVVVVNPARCKAVVQVPVISQLDLRDAAYAVAAANGWEFYNGHDAWDTWEVEQPLGFWADAYHLDYNTTSAPTRRFSRGVFAILPKEA